MSSATAARTRATICVATMYAALCAGAATAFAQQPSPSRSAAGAPPAVVQGRIRGPDKKPIEDAEVLLGDTAKTSTDRKGWFEFDPVPAGLHDVLVRKMGFSPVRFRLAVTEGDIWDGTITLETTAQALPAVVVLDSSKALQNHRPRWIDEFVERRRAGFGTFLDRVDIENANENSTARLLMRTPGMIVISAMSYDELRVGRCGGGAGSSARGVVYVNGLKAEDTSNLRFVSLKDYPPSFLSAIEVYRGAGSIPAEYYEPSVCLVVLLWLRR